MNLGASVLRLEDLRNRYVAKKAHVQGNRPDWAENDARLVVFNKCSGVLHSALLFRAVQDALFTRRGFWTEHFNQIPTDGDLAYQTREAEKFICFGLLQGLFSCVESSLRTFLRALDPGACNGGADAFASVYGCLLAKLKLACHRSLFDVLRLVRNTIHNNGVFVHREGKDVSVDHGGVIYPFRHGSVAAFVTWEWLMDRYQDLAGVLAEIALAEPLSLKGRMADPSSP